MSVGLPGSGIGGVFYLLSALLMPVDGALRSMRQRTRLRPRLIIRQASLAVAIVIALLLTGWAIEWFIVSASTSAFAFATGTVLSGSAVPRVLRAATFAITFGTLGAVLLTVQILRLFFGRTTVPGEAGTNTERKAA